MIKWKNKSTILETAETAYMEPPCCGKPITQEQRASMLQWGVWLKDGETLDAQGNKRGRGVRSMIASFWLFGVAAAFTNWTKLTVSYLNALAQFEKTGSEEELEEGFQYRLCRTVHPEVRRVGTATGSAEGASREAALPQDRGSRAHRSPEHDRFGNPSSCPGWGAFPDRLR